jgi:hypothetical protein
MGSCRRKNLMVALLAIALCALTPAFACANPLLSGYGGPGQGDQAILGATLLNGPSGGGGSTSSEASAGTAAALTAPEGGTSSSSSVVHEKKGTNGHPARRRHPSTTPKRTAAKEKSDTVLGSITLRSQDSSSSDPLGLSGIDFLYILLTLGALALTGGLTRQMVRRAH